MIDIEAELQRHLRTIAERAEPMPDVDSIVEGHPKASGAMSSSGRRPWLPAVAAIVVLVVGAVGVVAVANRRTPSVDTPTTAPGTVPDGTAGEHAGPIDVPGVSSVQRSAATPESMSFSQRVLTLLAVEYPGLVLQEHATRTTDSGHEVTWAYLLDGDRRLFIVEGPTGLIDPEGLRRTADGFEWPAEVGAVTTAITRPKSTVVVRSESTDGNHVPRDVDDVHHIAELVAASVPSVAGTNDTTEPSTTASPVLALPADDIAWERTTDIGSIARSQVTQAVAGPGGFVAVGMGFDDGRNQGRVWYSTDGHSWEEPALDLFDAKVIDTVAATSDAYFVVAYTNTDRLGLGEGANPTDAQLFRSIDGRNWEPWGAPWREAHVIGGVGGALLRSPSQPGPLEWSADGITWSAAEFPDSNVDGSYFNLRGGLAHTVDAIYLTGSTTNPSDEFSFAVWSSDDNGRSWHQLTTPPGLGTIATVPDGVVMIINPSDPDCAAATTSPDAQWTCTMRPDVYRYDTRTTTWAINPNQPGETVSGLPVARLNNTLVVALTEPSKALTIWTAPADTVDFTELPRTRLAYIDNTGSPGMAIMAASDNQVVVFTEDRLVDGQTAVIAGSLQPSSP